MSTTNILFERDVNVQASPKKAEDEKPKSMEYHRQVLESRLQEGKAAPAYISPSDTIMSPATQKLAAFKHKHMGKGSSTKARSLFAVAADKNHSNGTANSSQAMFADITKTSGPDFEKADSEAMRS